jgi:diguanylate cyclase (GGDEF)-like protein
LCVAAGYALGGIVDHVKGRRHVQRLAVLLGHCWHAVGPVVILALFAGPDPSWRDWPIYLAALAAQFAFDFVSSAGREWLAFGRSPKKLLPFFVWVYAVDILLAPLGLLAAFQSERSSFAFLLTLGPLGLLRLLARERHQRIERAQAFQQAYDGAHVEARRDALTGLANRLGWQEAVARAERALAEHSTPASVIVVDADDLKRANDTRGHDFGDELLRRIAALVRGTVRVQDVVARVGGDELAILLLNGDEHRCAEVVARLREAFEETGPLEGVPISAALGSATAVAGRTVSGALQEADRHMYMEKSLRDLARKGAAPCGDGANLSDAGSRRSAGLLSLSPKKKKESGRASVAAALALVPPDSLHRGS